MMELRIRDTYGLVDESFGVWLISRIQVKLISSLRKYNLTSWNKYFSESEQLERLYKIDYNIFNSIVFAAKNLVCTGTPGEITIHFNTTKFVPGFNRLLLNTFVKTINYGTRDTKACPVFTDTFKYFADDIDTYVKQYYMF